MDKQTVCDERKQARRHVCNRLSADGCAGTGVSAQAADGAMLDGNWPDDGVGGSVGPYTAPAGFAYSARCRQQRQCTPVPVADTADCAQSADDWGHAAALQAAAAALKEQSNEMHDWKQPGLNWKGMLVMLMAGLRYDAAPASGDFSMAIGGHADWHPESPLPADWNAACADATTPVIDHGAAGTLSVWFDVIRQAAERISDLICRYDPLKIPIPAAHAAVAGTSRPDGDALPGADVNADLAGANAYVAEIFQVKWPEQAGIGTLLSAAIQSLEGHEGASIALARQILLGRGHFGGNPDEAISESAADKYIRGWVAANIFGESVEAFIVKKIIERDRLMSTSIGNLHNFVINENLLRTSHVAGEIQGWIWREVVLLILPILQYQDGAETEQISDLKLHDWEWGLIHAGLLLARSGTYREGSDITSGEALALGKMLMAQLAESSVPTQWQYFFRLPAMVRYLLAQAEELQGAQNFNEPGLVKFALQDYFSSYEALRVKNDPFENFDYLFRQYKTRPELAQQVLDEQCPGMDLEPYLQDIKPFCEVLDLDTPRGREEKDFIDNHPNLVLVENVLAAVNGSPGATFTEALRSLGFDLSDGHSGFYLEDIDQKFNDQNEKIATAYGSTDKLLLVDAFGRLDSAEAAFIVSAEVRRLTVYFSAIDKFRNTEMANDPEVRRRYEITVDQGVDFLVASKDSEKRMFALEKVDARYRVILLGEQRSDYYQFLPIEQKLRINDHFQLNIYTGNDVMKQPGQSIDEQFIAQFVAKHVQDFKKQLYDSGYHKTTKAKVRDFILTLVPFYSCATSLDSGKTTEGVISCFMDVVSLIPLATRIAAISGKVSNSLALGGMTTMRNAFTETAARKSIHAVLKKAGTDFVYYGVKPASKVLNAKNMGALGKTTLRALDPGFELGARVGKASLKQAVKLGEKISELFPDSAAMLKKMERSMTHMPNPVPADQYQMAKIGNRGDRIAVTRLGGARYKQKLVYAEIDVDTGEVFGRKYTFASNGRLEPLPPQSARQLRNHRMASTGVGQAGHQANRHNAGQSVVSYSSSVRNSAFQQTQDGVTYELSYDLNRNLFYRDVAETNKRLWFSLDLNDNGARLVAASGRDTKKLRSQTARVTDDMRIKTLEKAGLDLGLTVNSKGRAMVRLVAPVAEIPRQLISIWAGRSAIPQNLIDNINRNAGIVQQCIAQGRGEFSFKIYLSADSPTWSDPQQRKLLQGVELIELERSEVFDQFRQTDYYRQYQAALAGNADVAGGRTHYASAVDVLRVYLLRQKGGIYMDIDDVIDKGLTRMSLSMGPEQIMLGARFDNPGMGMQQMFGNAIFGTHPDNPIMTQLLDEMLRRFNDNPNFYRAWKNPVSSDYPKQISQMTGPQVFNDVVERLPEVKQYLAANHFLKSADRDMLYTLRDTPLVQAITQQAKENPLTRLAKVNLPGAAHSWQSSR